MQGACMSAALSARKYCSLAECPSYVLVKNQVWPGQCRICQTSLVTTLKTKRNACHLTRTGKDSIAALPGNTRLDKAAKLEGQPHAHSSCMYTTAPCWQRCTGMEVAMRIPDKHHTLTFPPYRYAPSELPHAQKCSVQKNTKPQLRHLYWKAHTLQHLLPVTDSQPRSMQTMGSA